MLSGGRGVAGCAFPCKRHPTQHLWTSVCTAAKLARPSHVRQSSSNTPTPEQQAQASKPSSSRRLLLTLERSVGRSFGADDSLRSTRAFGAEVFPDLPSATTWGSMWRKLKESALSPIAAPAQQNGVSTSSPAVQGEADVQPEALKVMTVAANLRSMQEIEKRILSIVPSPAKRAEPSGASDKMSGRAADALLLVSGSHPVRTLPGSNLLLPSSLNILEASNQLKRAGAIAPTTQLWAVANPNVERDASLAEQKVAKGATLFLTQPPFDMDSFAAWVEDARARGVWESAQLVVGHPMVSSAGNLAFWMSLSSCLGKPACQQLLRQVSSAEASDKQQAEQLCAQYNERLVSQALSWDSTDGFHLMPITAKGREATQRALMPHGCLHFGAGH
ncbi:hypothetical protein DUNSADRAFT_14286 [Dunaliella salina]|uniref:Methylenetetrahydrofolate reductase (NAD(P)H) n=1 Tax=Dunaliella salina TaxID=3046 RepID=A0ABQ7H2M7_DUNSA|nr:hypothetical protein DUNSADRAFT_14286 [Dunaliella salina]|eukprot:KAF5841111.1 hypothetical protein DUNSADRAFT_14286 [Dunaliella salina]